MKVLWFTWKDRSHPKSGGAETVNEEIAKRLVRNGHEVIFLVAGFDGATEEEEREGFRIIRLGNHFSVYWRAYRYYKKHLEGLADVVIEEVNTIPFFTRLYVKEKTFLFVHQLCREVWFYQMLFPMNLIGYLVEPLYLWFLRKDEVITISNSTKNDLVRYGFRAEKIHIISEGIEIEPLLNLESVEKYPFLTLLSLGSMREMKRTAHQIAAFEIAKKSIQNLQMKIAGDAESSYGQKILRMIEHSAYRDDIEYLGKIGTEKKKEIMQKSHLILVTSVKEGWGLIVTESASQGTPAAVYDVDGLRDSVRDGETGVIVKKNTPDGLAEVIKEIFSDTKRYDRMRKSAWEWSRDVNFAMSHRDFLEVIEKK